MKILLICFLSFNSMLFAQELSWKSGALVLDSDKVYVGEISMQDAYDLVLFRAHDSVTVYPAHRIKDVRFYDGGMNVNRKYISLEDNQIGHKSFHLYEVVLQGEWSVLRKKQSMALVSINSGNDRDDFQYYLKSKDQLVSIMQFRTRVYQQLLENSRNEILSFIAVNKLDPNEPASAIRIIDFYNKQAKVNAVALNVIKH